MAAGPPAGSGDAAGPGRVGVGAVLLTLGLLAIAEAPLAAQAQDPPARGWLSLGVGGGRARGLESDMGGMLQANVQWGPHHTAARMLFLGDLGSFPDGSDDSVGEFSILYGRRTAGRWGHASLATGLAYVRGEGFPGTYDRVRSGAGVPVVGEVLLHARLVGVGLQLFANLNTVSIYGGAMLSLHLGWMP